MIARRRKLCHREIVEQAGGLRLIWKWSKERLRNIRLCDGAYFRRNLERWSWNLPHQLPPHIQRQRSRRICSGHLSPFRTSLLEITALTTASTPKLLNSAKTRRAAKKAVDAARVCCL